MDKRQGILIKVNSILLIRNFKLSSKQGMWQEEDRLEQDLRESKKSRDALSITREVIE